VLFARAIRLAPALAGAAALPTCQCPLEAVRGLPFGGARLCWPARLPFGSLSGLAPALAALRVLRAPRRAEDARLAEGEGGVPRGRGGLDR
jgi:hypothetical protein